MKEHSWVKREGIHHQFEYEQIRTGFMYVCSGCGREVFVKDSRSLNIEFVVYDLERDCDLEIVKNVQNELTFTDALNCELLIFNITVQDQTNVTQHGLWDGVLSTPKTPM